MKHNSYNDYLVHYGVKGMRWGVRHDPERHPRSAKGADLKKKSKIDQKKQQKLEKQLKKDFQKNWYSTYNKAADNFNKKIGSVNKKYEGVKFDSNFSSKKGQQYVREVDRLWRTEYKRALKQDYGENAKLFVNNAPFMNEYAEFIKNK